MKTTGLRKSITPALVHLTGLALVGAMAAYWAVRVFTPPPSVAPAAAVTAAPRTASPVLAARLFGLVQADTSPASAHVRVAGLFAAGSDSAAVLVVGDAPPRTFALGQEVSPGVRLVEVRADAVVLERDGVRQELAAPALPAPMAGLGGTPVRAYRREGDTLSADPAAGPARPTPTPTRAAPALVPTPATPGGGDARAPRSGPMSAPLRADGPANPRGPAGAALGAPTWQPPPPGVLVPEPTLPAPGER